MKYAEQLKKKLCKEIDEISERGGQLKQTEIELLHKMTDIVKNIDKIEMLESAGDDMSMRGSYRGENMSRNRSYHYNDDGDSYARRGQHYVRGHYSYADEGMRDDMSNARSRRGYSRGDAKDIMLEKMGEMMSDADGKEREILKKAMRQIEEID